MVTIHLVLRRDKFCEYQMHFMWEVLCTFSSNERTEVIDGFLRMINHTGRMDTRNCVKLKQLRHGIPSSVNYFLTSDFKNQYIIQFLRLE
jgi:hypothetical protein